MTQTSCTFFDGITSVPKLVELKIDAFQHAITITSSEFEPLIWVIEDIRIEHLGACLEIRNLKNPVAFLKVSDACFISYFIDLMNTKGQIGWYYKILQLGMKAYIGIAIIILALIAGGYWFLIPWVAEKAVLIIPESYDASLGSTFFTEYLTKNNVDSSKTVLLNQFAHELKLQKTRGLHFTVVNSSEVNAFALPDGNIIVYSGLLDLIKNYDELACLMGHEVIHVNQRHSMKMLCRNLSGYIFISAVFSDVNGIMAVIADNAHNLQSLSYSREFEKQADEEGTTLMIHNNVNPNGMTRLFSRLKENDYINIPAFISSHPLTNDRIETINHFIINTQHKNYYQPELQKLFNMLKE